MSNFQPSQSILKLAIAVLLGVVLAAACQQAPSVPLDQVTVHLKWFHQAQFAGLYVAEKKGFYADQKLDIRFVPGGADAPSIPAVVSGQAQFGVSSADELIKARVEGLPVIALAVVFQESPVAYVAMTDSGIERPEDFVGHRVGLILGSGTEVPYYVMMANLKVDRSQIEEVPIAFGLDPFYRKEIDVLPTFIINEPGTIRRAGYDINVFLTADYGVNLYSDVLFTTDDMIAQHPDLVRRFVQASIQGWVYTTEHPLEALDAVMAYDPDGDRQHQQDMLNASIRLVIPGGIPVGSMNAAKWQESHDLLLKYGVIDKSVDIESLYTLEFLERTP